jgi:Zn-dependent protease with chaperone function
MGGYWKSGLIVASVLAVVAGGAPTAPAQQAAPSARASKTPTPSQRRVDPSVAERLKAVMVPLLQHMDRPIPLNQVQIGFMDAPQINAANAGGGHFYVTTGLLEKANDDQLRAVMAHETAHADLGHVAKAQRLRTGVSIGMILLNQAFPSTSAITPIAGQLIANSYSRKEEYQADAHGVEILQRAGYAGKGLMADTLTWLKGQEGSAGSGGFFATHPATGDRIGAVRRLPDRPRAARQ